MNEVAKTATFAVAAVVALGLGIWSHVGPAATGVTKQQVVGQSLFGELKPEAAKSLEIIEYDTEKGTPKAFRVAQENGLWRIPSHEDYPADASQQLGEAAAALVACEIINIEGDEPAGHVTYGVVDPDPKSLASGATGVGKRVTMEDGSGKKLAQVIIGKGIKDKPDLHYVRIPGQDRVYVVKLKTDKFSTKFEDWIEKDLLKLNAWDIQRVAFNDYSIDELRRAILPRSKIQLGYDTKDSKWKLDELEVFNGELRDFEPQKLADEEELNATKLNELRSALDELKIVDVRRKPEGLAADLRVGEGLADNEEALESLVRRGFHLVPTGDGQSGIFSNEGEILCGTKEGVDYTLRFGRIAGGGESQSKSEGSEESADSEGEKTEGKETGANRFIMVTVAFNEDLLTKPELTSLPDESPDAPETEGKEESKEEAAKTSANDASLSDADGQLAQADDTDDANDAKAAKPEKKDAKAGGKADEKKPPIAKPKSREALERERITKENERKQKEYDDKVKKGKEKVKELSDRFADWYYVVSDATYQKIHLGRDEIIKKKTAPGDAKKDEHDHDHDHDDADVLKQEDKSLAD